MFVETPLRHKPNSSMQCSARLALRYSRGMLSTNYKAI